MAPTTNQKLNRREFLKLMGTGAATAVLASCAPAATQVAATIAPTTIVPEGEVTIWDRAGDLFQVMDAAIPAFNKKYPKIKINHQAIETAKIPPTLTAGVDVPDGAFIEDEWLGVIQEHLTDISQWIAPYTKDLVNYKVRVNTHDGKIKGIPYDVDPALLYYRADILDKNGVKIEDVKTYDDMITVAKALQAKDSKLKPIRIENTPALIILWASMFANQMGTSYINENGDLQIENDKFLKMMNWLKKVVDEKVASRVDLFSPDDIAACDTDVQVFVPYAIWYNYGIGNLLKDSKGKWRAARLPAWEAGGNTAASMGGSSFIIPAKGKNPGLAWLWYEFIMLSSEGTVAAFGPNAIYAKGIDTLLPAYKPAYTNKLMDNPAGLGGQDLWAIATDVAKDIPDNYYFPKWYINMADIFGANVQRLYDGELSPEETLKKSADEIKSKLMR